MISPNDYYWMFGDDDDQIDFEPITHRYTNAKTNIPYVGVTTFIGQFEEEFDVEYHSARCAVKEVLGQRSYSYAAFKLATKNKPKELVYQYIRKHEKRVKFLVKQQELKDQWKAKNEFAKEKGHIYHQKQEDKVNFNQFRIVEGGHVRPLADTRGLPRSRGNKINLSATLPDGVYAELLVKNHKLRMSGQVDYSFIETIGRTRYVDIDDYKTNEKLGTQTFNNFLPPLDFLPQNKMNIYRIQILLYAEMFRAYGYTPRRLSLTYHPSPELPPKVYAIQPFTEYPVDPIKLMLTIRKTYINSLN